MPAYSPMILQLLPSWKLERTTDAMELKVLVDFRGMSALVASDSRFLTACNSVSPSTSTSHHLELEGQPQNEVSINVFKNLLNEYQERNNQQNRELAEVKQQRDDAISVQNRLGQRLAEIASFALLVYRGSPIQVFPDIHEIIDVMFTQLFETTIHIRRFEKDDALSSLESLMSQMEILQSFLRRAEATCHLFTGGESGRPENERFLLTHIPPQVVIPSFGLTLDQTRLPFPERRPSQLPNTPPNSPVVSLLSNVNGHKRARPESFKDGEIPAKRRC
ncbi:hypothetical protein K435DRAFT_795528 [Dendrothele bispora CBS 962.96]|uniref:Uncharacterized protein n=1 Tax=Dendrothele bispora (strain CBS 962.96) TaxID=1314807 RepID=A0A4S8M9X4_DENBC|nr:hypothetical protein K435DRAFT_795528 [Dendrothele bispora CBS 962.96]